MQTVNQTEKGLSWWQIIGSTLAAVIGVQSRKNKERDFTQGDIKKFIIAGIGFTICFLLGLIMLVNVVVASSPTV